MLRCYHGAGTRKQTSASAHFRGGWGDEETGINSAASDFRCRDRQRAWETAPGGPLRSNRLDARLSGTDPNDILEGRHEDFPIPHVAGLCRFGDGLDRLVQLIVADDNFDF